MIKAINLSFSYTGQYLYKNISFTIEPMRHCVLVGSNGTGKTTLADMLVDPDKYLYEGKIIRDGNIRTGYVSQFVKHEGAGDENVFDFLCADFRRMQSEMDAICLEMEGECEPEVFDRYQNAVDEFDAVDGYNYETNIHKRLKIAGLQQLENVPVSKVSGGEYKLLQIIRQMLRLPDLLVMDEPDTFLDFENLNGLRSLINTHEGTMLVVTHNRFILNHCFDKVLHLEDSGLREFDGSYTDYNFALLQMKVEKQKAVEKETEWIMIQQELVERLRKDATEVISPQKGRALKARVSYVEHLMRDRTEEPYLEVREPKIKLPEVEYAENEPEFALRVSDYSLAFERKLLENVNFEIGPHDKVALVGANGTGKTTMLCDIWERRKPGIEFNEGIKAAFLSQLYGETLNEENTLMQELDFDTVREAEMLLRDYCFEEGSAERKVKELSGGEKNLLQLAKLSKSGAGLLILDEPTSHLDIYAQLALERALSEYKGAVLMVSHDFYSIANCVDYVLYVENGTVRRQSSRAFRKMIYKNYFSREYLELEQQKKELEMKIGALLRSGDYKEAEEKCSELENVIANM